MYRSVEVFMIKEEINHFKERYVDNNHYNLLAINLLNHSNGLEIQHVLSLPFQNIINRNVKFILH